MLEVSDRAEALPNYAFGRRRAKALIGWLSIEEGALWLGGRQTSAVPSKETIRACEWARRAVAKRPQHIDQSGLVSDCPRELTQYIEELHKTKEASEALKMGGEVHMVDLTKVCAAQPQILIHDAEERIGDLDPSDLREIAKITLPSGPPEQVPAVFDQGKNAWILSSANPNLRVRANFNVQAGPGLPGFGFIVSVQKSYMQVAGLNGRYFLRDGYHRAYGLLAAGIRHVPALVRDFHSFEEVGLPAGLLPQRMYLGDHPPLLPDYFDDEVSAETTAPATQHTIVVQALEIRALG